MIKNLSAMQETGFDPWVGNIPWRRESLPTLVFLPGEFYGQKSLVATVHGVAKLDMTEQPALLLLLVPMCESNCLSGLPGPHQKSEGVD